MGVPVLQTSVGTVVADINTQEFTVSHTGIQPSVEREGDRIMCREINWFGQGHKAGRTPCCLCDDISRTFTGNRCIAAEGPGFPLGGLPRTESFLKGFEKEVGWGLCFLRGTCRGDREIPGVEGPGVLLFVVADAELPGTLRRLSLQRIRDRQAF